MWLPAASVKRKLGETTFREIEFREDLRVALQVIFTLGLALNPLVANPLSAPTEGTTSEDLGIDLLLQRAQVPTAIKTEEGLLKAARTLGLEDIVENYSKLQQLVKETIAEESKVRTRIVNNIYNNRLVWYVGYGSNLYLHRF